MALLIKHHGEGRVLGEAELGCLAARSIVSTCGVVIRPEPQGRVVRQPAMQIDGLAGTLGVRRWITRDTGDGRVLPGTWLAAPGEGPNLQYTEPYVPAEPPAALDLPRPAAARRRTRAA